MKIYSYPKVKNVVLVSLLAAFVVGCHNGSTSSGNGSTNNQASSQSKINGSVFSLWDPVNQVSKVVVVDATGKQKLYTGAVASHPSNNSVQIDLPLLLHANREFVKLYDNNNILISVGQLGNFIESSGSHLEMNNSLTALGSYLVGTAISASTDLTRNPMGALDVLAKNYKSEDLDNPYLVLGAKFISLQRGGLAESAATASVLKMLDQYPQLVTPLPLDNAVLEIISAHLNATKASLLKSAHGGVMKSLQAVADSKEDSKDNTVDYSTIQIAQNLCYKDKAFLGNEAAISSCVAAKIVAYNGKYSDPKYAADITAVSQKSATVSGFAMNFAINKIADTAFVTSVAKDIKGLTGLECSLSPDVVSTTSKWLGYANTLLTVMPIPFNLIGSTVAGGFNGMCPGQQTQNNPQLTYMTKSLDAIAKELSQVHKEIQDLAVAVNANTDKLINQMNDNSYRDSFNNVYAALDYNEKLYGNFKNFKVSDNFSSGNKIDYDPSQPQYTYLRIGEDLRSTTATARVMPSFVTHFVETFDNYTKNATGFSIMLNSMLADCEKRKIDATPTGVGVGSGITACSAVYTQYYSRFVSLGNNLYVAGSNIYAAESNLGNLAEAGVLANSSNAISPAKMLEYLGQKLDSGKFIDNIGAQINFQERFESSQNAFRKGLDFVHAGYNSAGEKFYMSAQDYVYTLAETNTSLDSVLNSIKSIPECSVKETIVTKDEAGKFRQSVVDRANILDYIPSSKELKVVCDKNVVSYKVDDGSAIMFAGALLPQSSGVHDGDDVHINGDQQSATGWEVYRKENPFLTKSHYRTNNGPGGASLNVVNDDDYSDIEGSNLFDTSKERGYKNDRFAKIGFWVASNIHVYPLGYGDECLLTGSCHGLKVNTRTQTSMDHVLLKQTPYLSVGGSNMRSISWASDRGYPDLFDKELAAFDHPTRYGDVGDLRSLQQWTGNDTASDIIYTLPNKDKIEPSHTAYKLDGTSEQRSIYEGEFSWLGYFTNVMAVYSKDQQDNVKGASSYLAYVKAPIVLTSYAEPAHSDISLAQRKEITMVGAGNNGIIHPFALQYEIVYHARSVSQAAPPFVEHKARLLCLTKGCRDEMGKREDTVAFVKDQHLRFDDGTQVTLRANDTANMAVLLSPNSALKRLGTVHGYVVEMK